MEAPVCRPAMSDITVIAKTGKTLAQWFRFLDAAGASRLDHKDIVSHLGKRGVGPWWRQMLAVEYERARGLREVNQNATGYSVSVSRTLEAGVPELWRAAANLRRRRKWFPPGLLRVSSQKEDKFLRGAWNGDARIAFGFHARPGGRAQIVVQVDHLTGKDEVERQRGLWKKAFVKLEALLIP